MTLRYCFAKLRRSILPILACSAAVCVVTLILTVSSSMPSLLDGAVKEYNRQLSGSADITVTISENSSDRFFGLSNFEDLSEHAEYIAGHFQAFAQIRKADAAEDLAPYCTLYASDYVLQNVHNPVVAPDRPEALGSGGAVLGKAFAERLGIQKGQRIELSFGGKTQKFTAECIAENEGLFFTGDAVLITGEGLRRINPVLAPGIVTTAFIKAKTPDSLQTIQTEIEKNSRFAVASVLDNERLGVMLDNFRAPVAAIGALSAVFCVIALAALSRLSFAGDRENFEILRRLGMPERKIILITVFSGITICFFAFLGAVILDFSALTILRAASPLFRGARFGFLQRLLGYGGGFLLAVMAAAVFGRAKTKPNKAPQDSRGRILFPVLCLIALSVSIAAIFLMETVPVFAAVMAVLSGAGLVVFTIRSLAPLFGIISDKVKNLYTLRLASQTKKPAFRRYLTFLTSGALVTLMAVATAGNMRTTETKQASYPFDLAVTAVSSPTESFYDSIADLDETALAARASIKFNAKVSDKSAAFYTTVIGLDETGFGAFGASVPYASGGAVIGRRMAEENRIRVGDTLIYSAQGGGMPFVVTDIIKTDYLNGSFVLAPLERFATPARPFTEILITAGGDLNTAARAVSAAASAADASVLGMREFGKYTAVWFSEFKTLLNAYCVLISALCAVAALFMIIIRRRADTETVDCLFPFGLSESADKKQNAVILAAILLPFAVLWVYLLFVFSEAMFPLFFALGSRVKFHFNLPLAALTALLLATVAIFMEIAVCHAAWKRRKNPA